jgi:CRISPR-associated protein (TIGR03986 family)
MSITAPFNFVPLSDKVFFPPWAEDVSHDIPFEDGESGVIDITITAKSPIFIRDSKNEEQFCNYNGEYYIPATSVKGMVRNVLEIMSFSKIPIDTKTHEKHMSVRDMSNSKVLVGVATGCGFLKQDENDEWYIEDYGSPRTIAYSDKNSKTLKLGNEEELNCNFETAKEKYEENGTYKIIKVDNSVKDLINRNSKKIGTKNIATPSQNGEDAYLVLTGGIDNKKNEFVFTSSDKSDTPIKDISAIVEKFKKVYFTSDSVDGNFWKKNYDKNIGIPIFYKKEKGKITDIGLSQLFKLLYPYTINDATKQQSQQVKITTKDEEENDFAFDLAQTIFGATRDKATSLKGRVQFSHFKADSKPAIFKKITTILGSPNTSYYPEYIVQNCKDGKVINNDYTTLMEEKALIAGWKRYPLHLSKPNPKIVEPSDTTTTFFPLGTYSGDKFNEFTFKGKLRFHNLKRVELGALISALTFHNSNEIFYHNIGMAKSFGFGKIQINIDTQPYLKNLEAFELLMNEWTEKNVKNKWIDTPQLQELTVMAFKDLNIDKHLKYLNLDPDKKVNEFTDKKNIKLRGTEKGRECLPKVSSLFDIGHNSLRSLLTDEVLASYETERLYKEELQKYTLEYEQAINSDNLQIIENFINKYKTTKDIVDVEKHFFTLQKAQESNKHQKVNEEAKKAWDGIHDPKYAKSLQKSLASFIKKWEKKNKGSEFVLELVEKAKAELK